MTHRMFVAAYPTEEAVAELEEFLDVRRDADQAWRWSRPENWHLTLAFLPAVPERRVEDVVEALAQVAQRSAPNSAALAGSGAFPLPEAARVLYLGIDTDRVWLDGLAGRIRTAVGRAGVDVDGGTFRPHLTVARSRRPHEATRWLRILETFRGSSFAVDSFALVDSVLGAGPDRTALHRIEATFDLAP